MSHVDDGTLHAYLDGALSPAEAQGIAAHVAQCPACRGRLDEERALIARAGELLALAAPPDRELPPFRPGDLKPPRRLWSQVRLPVAWAATVVLALGIGVYLGSVPVGYMARPVPAPAPAPTPTPTPPSTSVPRREAQARALPAPAAAPSAIRRTPEQAERMVLRDGIGAAGRASAVATGFTLDSARAVLGQDPVVLPGVPMRAIRRDHRVGYTGLIVIEQQLDSFTVVELVEGRPALFKMDAIAVTPAEERGAQDSATRRELRARAGAPAAKAAARPGAVETQHQLLRRLGNLDVRISGPLSTDSLQKLLQLARPVEP